LELREKAIELKLEQGRKVSILKNIQTQLNQKVAECELVNRQLQLYKTRCDILNILCTKYSLNFDQLTVSSIENGIRNLDNKMLISDKACSITYPTIPSTIETPSNVMIQETLITKPTDIIDEPKTSDNDIDDGDDGDDIEVVDFDYKGQLYYIDNIHGDIYARLSNGDVGDIIGYRTEKGHVKFGQRKK